MKTNSLAFFILGVSLASSLVAQVEPDADRGVARISVINGDVSVRRGDSGDWVAAAINAPLVVNDAIYAGARSRAEVQFDSSNFIRLGANSEVHVGGLDNGRYLVQVARGVATFRVLRDFRADIEISTPNVSVRPRELGTYRIEVREDGTTEVSVRTGQAEINTPAGSETLSAGHTMLARGSNTDSEFQMVAATPYDDWDRWNESRDRELQRSRSYQHVSRDISGAEDLDGYGTWDEDSKYGSVWYPQVTAEWAPYREGHWVWEDWYGWTWVSYDPWGWAPYHYGRWFQGSRGWCWWPGGPGRHRWSPALVAFFGYGGVGVGVGFGHMGWVPLGPYEPFHRWWGAGYYGGRNTMMLNNLNIAGMYRNARVTNGMTGMSSSEFGRGGRAVYRGLNSSDLRSAQLVRGQVPITPQRESLRMADRAVRTENLPRSTGNQHFFSTRPPSQTQRMSFEDQRRGMQTGSRPMFGTGPRAAVNSSVAGGGNSGGWQRFGGVNSSSAGSPANRNQTSGWRSSGSASPQRSMPSSQSSSGGGWRSSSSGSERWIGSGNQPVRINRPMMHERTATGGGGASSAPRVSSGGGGGGHSSGGGHSGRNR